MPNNRRENRRKQDTIKKPDVERRVASVDRRKYRLRITKKYGLNFFAMGNEAELEKTGRS